MKRLAIFVLFVLLLAFPALADENFNIMAYSNMIVENFGNQDTTILNRTRIRLEANPMIGMYAQYEYDFAKHQTTYAFVKVDTTLAGIKFSFLAGQMLNPVWQQTVPSPRKLQTIRYPAAMQHFAVPAPGLGIWLEKNGIQFKTVTYSHNQTVTLIHYQKLYLFYDSGAQYGTTGFIFNLKETDCWYFNPSLGAFATKHDAGGFLNNYFQLPYNLRIYGELNIDDLVDGERKIWLMGGLSYQYGQNSLIKFYYDELITSARLEIAFFMETKNSN